MSGWWGPGVPQPRKASVAAHLAIKCRAYSATVSGVCWIEGLFVSERKAIDHSNEIEIEPGR